MIYIIPFYRLTQDVARVLSENFEGIQIFRFLSDEFKKYSQIAVIGIRKERQECPGQVNVLLRQVMAPENIPLLDNLAPQSIPIPSSKSSVSLFQGAVFNQTELAAQLAHSKCSISIQTLSRSENSVRFCALVGIPPTNWFILVRSTQLSVQENTAS